MKSASDVWWMSSTFGPLILYLPTLIGMLFLYFSYLAHKRGKPPAYCLAIAIIPAAILGLVMGWFVFPRGLQAAWAMLTDHSKNFVRFHPEMEWLRYPTALITVLVTGGLFIFPSLLVGYSLVFSDRTNKAVRWTWWHRALLITIALSYPLTHLLFVVLGSSGKYDGGA